MILICPNKCVDSQHSIEQAVLSVCGIATLGGASTIGALFAVGIVSGPAGWAASGAMTAAAAAVAAFVLIGGIVVVKINNEVSVGQVRFSSSLC